VGAAAGEAIKLASESSAGEAVHEWLKQHYPFGTHETPTQLRSAGEAAATPGTHPLGGSPAEVGHVAVAPEARMLSVEASRGHGYEWMMKRLWEQMQEKNIPIPASADPDSDMYKLLNADAKTIDSVVHNIASDQTHGFFNADGTSVRIDMGSHMTIGADGQIHLNGAVHAAENMPVTPPYHPEVPATAEAPAPAEAVGERPVPTRPVYLDMQPDTEAPAVSETSTDTAPESEAPAASEVVTNEFGLEVAPDKPHMYAGDEHTFVYGGSSTEQSRMLGAYLLRHPQEVVFGADASGEHRVPWHLVEGKVVAGPPMRTEGFLGLFSTFMDPPGPEEFKKIIG
jgi:hypothetical protein